MWIGKRNTTWLLNLSRQAEVMSLSGSDGRNVGKLNYPLGGSIEAKILILYMKFEIMRGGTDGGK